MAKQYFLLDLMNKWNSLLVYYTRMFVCYVVNKGANTKDKFYIDGVYKGVSGGTTPPPSHKRWDVVVFSVYLRT